MASDGYTPSDGDTAGGTTDSTSETGGGDSGESAGSGDDDGCQSIQASSAFALLLLLLVLYFQRPTRWKAIRVRRKQDADRRPRR